MRPERLTTGSPLAESSPADQRTEGSYQRMVGWLRQRLCRHSYYIEDLKRVSPECVTCCCYKCGKQKWAEYGLALSPTWERKPANEKADLPPTVARRPRSGTEDAIGG